MDLRYDGFDAFCLVGHEPGRFRARLGERRESVGQRRSGHQEMDRIFRADEGIGECNSSFGKRIGLGSGRRRARSMVVFEGLCHDRGRIWPNDGNEGKIYFVDTDRRPKDHLR